MEGDDGELYRLERRDGKTKVVKAGAGKGTGCVARKCFRRGREGHIRPDCTAKTHVDGGAPRPAPRSKGAGSLDTENGSPSGGDEGNLGLGHLELNALAVKGDRGSQRPRATAEAATPAAAVVAAAWTPKRAKEGGARTPATQASSGVDPWSASGSDPWQA